MAFKKMGWWLKKKNQGKHVGEETSDLKMKKTSAGMS